MLKYLTIVFGLIMHVSGIAQIPAQKADDFVNSIGVATHLRYSGVYANSTNIKNQLLNLGIKHIRDAVDTKFVAVNELKLSGIKITGYMQGDFDIATQTPAFWIQQAKKAGAIDGFEAFEGPNEADLPMMSFTYKGQGWPEGVKAFQRDIYTAVKSDPTISDRPVLGPTIGSGLKTTWANSMGDISAYVDFGNFHYYKAWGQSYSEGGNEWSLQAVKNFHNVMFGNKPYMATEGSYSTAVASESGIGEQLNAKYTLRFFLEYWRIGVVRTFKYELFDEGVNDSNLEDKFGLIENDGITMKPAGTAVKNMIALLKEPEPSKNFTPESLNFSIANADSYTHYNLLQKSTGKFYLIIWNDAPSWNNSTKTEIVNSDSVTITFNQNILESKLYAPCTNGITAVTTLSNPKSLDVVIPNHPYIYEIIVPNFVTNVEQNMVLQSISIFPNPAKNSISVYGISMQKVAYEITGLEGKVLQRGLINDENISIEDIQPGIYVIKIKSESGDKVMRFVKE